MGSYGEYCPIAVGAEFFGDRWTPLVLRELIVGCSGFNEIHRGLPKMSRSLLSQRLRVLERRGLVERNSHGPGRSVEYVLTPAGKDLEPIIWQLGHWAARWAFGEPADEVLDAAWLAWRLHQHVDTGRLPQTRTVVELDLSGPGGGRAWLVLDRGGSTACLVDPGYDVDLAVLGDNREMHRWLLGRTTWRDVIASGVVRMVGPSRHVRAFPTWFDNSLFGADFGKATRTRHTPAHARSALSGFRHTPAQDRSHSR